MGLVKAEITLGNPRNKLSMKVNVMADSGALLLCLPEHIAIQLQLEELEKREVILADGSRIKVSYSGPVEIRFENRSCFTGALILGDEPLLGVVPMEDMDILIDPVRQRLIVNPENPNIPVSPVKRIRIWSLGRNS